MELESSARMNSPSVVRKNIPLILSGHSNQSAEKQAAKQLNPLYSDDYLQQDNLDVSFDDDDSGMHQQQHKQDEQQQGLVSTSLESSRFPSQQDSSSHLPAGQQTTIINQQTAVHVPASQQLSQQQTVPLTTTNTMPEQPPQTEFNNIQKNIYPTIYSNQQNVAQQQYSQVVDYDEPRHKGRRLNWHYSRDPVGRRLAQPLIHFCQKCEHPIIKYGRLTPCKHAFCIRCANSMFATSSHHKECFRCGTSVEGVVEHSLGEIHICTFGGSKHGLSGCRRSYCSGRDLDAHYLHRHKKIRPIEMIPPLPSQPSMNHHMPTTVAAQQRQQKSQQGVSQGGGTGNNQSSQSSQPLPSGGPQPLSAAMIPPGTMFAPPQIPVGMPPGGTHPVGGTSQKSSRETQMLNHQRIVCPPPSTSGVISSQAGMILATVPPAGLVIPRGAVPPTLLPPPVPPTSVTAAMALQQQTNMIVARQQQAALAAQIAAQQATMIGSPVMLQTSIAASQQVVPPQSSSSVVNMSWQPTPPPLSSGK